MARRLIIALTLGIIMTAVLWAVLNLAGDISLQLARYP